MTVKVIPFFCTVHPLLRIILGHPRWRRFFPLARKEQIGAAFAELKLLFTIIMPQIGLWCDSTFWVCGRNPMMWPFKCKLSACTYTRCYLFFRIWENEIVTFGWNLVLAKFGSEKVERSLSPYKLPLSKGTSYCQWRFFSSLCCPMRICIHCREWYEESFHRNRLL